MNRLALARQRVRAAEAELETQRGAMREQLENFRLHGRTAITPVRVVGGGLALGLLAGLLRRRRRRPAADTTTATTPGWSAQLGSLLRLASAIGPFIAPMWRSAGARPAEAGAAASPEAPPGDPLQ